MRNDKAAAMVAIGWLMLVVGTVWFLVILQGSELVWALEAAVVAALLGGMAYENAPDMPALVAIPALVAAAAVLVISFTEFVRAQPNGVYVVIFATLSATWIAGGINLKSFATDVADGMKGEV